ncbi:MAG: hypothetical protein HY326_08715 [Chloroflexi bacterium]|nr:hypothetical protein [Chloroflexota bacterium]
MNRDLSPNQVILRWSLTALWLYTIFMAAAAPRWHNFAPPHEHFSFSRAGHVDGYQEAGSYPLNSAVKQVTRNPHASGILSMMPTINTMPEAIGSWFPTIFAPLLADLALTWDRSNHPAFYVLPPEQIVQFVVDRPPVGTPGCASA